MVIKNSLKKGGFWLLFFFLISSLGATVYLVKRQQELRRGAVGSGDISFYLNPASIAKNQGETFLVQVELISSDSKQLTVAGVDLTFDPDVFRVSNVSCDPNFGAAGPQNGVEDNQISLTCYRYLSSSGPQPPLALAANTPLTLGSFEVEVIKNPVSQETSEISFSRTRVPDTATFDDLADEGQPGQYVIDPITTISPEPSLSPIPTITTTPTSMPTSNPTATPTPTGVYECTTDSGCRWCGTWCVGIEYDGPCATVMPPEGYVCVCDDVTGTCMAKEIEEISPTPVPTDPCSMGPLGDLDCNGVIDVFDLTALIREWGDDREGSKADLRVDGKVDVFDLVILINNWTRDID